MAPRPKIGATVHYVDDGEHCTDAVVVEHCEATGDEGSDCLHLRRLDVGRHVPHVPYDDGDDDGPLPYSWHQPDDHDDL